MFSPSFKGILALVHVLHYDGEVTPGHICFQIRLVQVWLLRVLVNVLAVKLLLGIDHPIAMHTLWRQSIYSGLFS